MWKLWYIAENLSEHDFANFDLIRKDNSSIQKTSQVKSALKGLLNSPVNNLELGCREFDPFR